MATLETSTILRGRPKRSVITLNQLRNQSKDLGRRSQKVIETAKEQVQDALKEDADAFKQAKKVGA